MFAATEPPRATAPRKNAGSHTRQSTFAGDDQTVDDSQPMGVGPDRLILSHHFHSASTSADHICDPWCQIFQGVVVGDSIFFLDAGANSS